MNPDAAKRISAYTTTTSLPKWVVCRRENAFHSTLGGTMPIGGRQTSAGLAPGRRIVHVCIQRHIRVLTDQKFCECVVGQGVGKDHSSLLASWSLDGGSDKAQPCQPYVPEPGTSAMLLAGLVAMIGVGARRMRS